MLGGIALPLGLIIYPLLDMDGLPRLAAFVVTALPVIFWMYIAAGMIAWWRRPRSGVGMLLMWTGLTVWVVGLYNTTVPVFQAIGPVFTSLVLAAIVHLLLAFPTGRLHTTAERVIVAGMYFSMLVLPAPLYLFDPAGPSPSLVISDQPVIVTVFGYLRAIASNGFGLVAGLAAAARLMRTRRGHRLALAAFYGYGGFVVVFTLGAAWVFRAWWPDQQLTLAAVQFIAIAVLPIAVLAMFQLGGYRPTTELEALGAWLGESERTRTPIDVALADALGDPSLAVRYWSTELGAWVDADGLPAAAQERRAGRARYELGLGGQPLAAIDYDHTVPRDPREVERAASLVALALERERLTAQLKASRQAVVDSRERVVAAADAERRRISRGLHDGLQARLLLIGIDAGRIATASTEDTVAARATTLRDDIDRAAAELRAFVNDLVPPALIELGVGGAVEELIESMPIPTQVDVAIFGRLGDGVELTAYLIVAEGLANVVKHSGADNCAVTLRTEGSWLHVEVRDDGNAAVDPSAGTGLAGIRDRVAAAGGHFGISTPSEGGTTLWAVIPLSQ
jgi:signal transduction histidine kinase